MSDLTSIYTPLLNVYEVVSQMKLHLAIEYCSDMTIRYMKKVQYPSTCQYIGDRCSM